MNPFQLTGFKFLSFYVLVGIAVVWGLRIWLRQRETANAPPQQNMTDPYLIAYLRAGANEALRVATFALLDRGLLVAKAEKLKRKDVNAVGVAQRPIEKAILQFYAREGEGHEIFKDPGAKNACESYGQALKLQGMLADRSTFSQRLAPAAIALAILVGITWIKISIALSQGRHNVGFLTVLTAVFACVVLYVWFRPRTGLGDAMMADLKSLFDRLKVRAKTLQAGGATNEAALLAAVFGLAAVPAAAFPFLEKLYPKKSSDGSGCGSSSCSSGDSSGGGGGG
ncbi:MAG: TIGR04222 domain-containing membrane protein, partial [Usitatibacteraceae bacterium]